MIHDIFIISESKIHGLGVMALCDFPKDYTECIHGEYIPSELDDGTCFEIEGDYSLKPYAPYRYLNHSENPNCEVIELEDFPGLWLSTKQIIKAGEELTIDYGFDPTKA